MSEPGARPGGLTALAIINFVVAIMSFMSCAGKLLMPVFLPEGIRGNEARVTALEAQAASEASPENEKELEAARADLESVRVAHDLGVRHRALFILSAAASGVAGLLLVISGVGYLKLHRFWGRILGTVFAVGSLAWFVYVAVRMYPAMNEPLPIFELLTVVYSTVTLLAVWGFFRHDFGS